MSKLAVGLILDSFVVPNWQWSLIEKIHLSDYASISLVLLNTSEKVHPEQKLLKSRIYQWYLKLEKLKLKKPVTASKLLDSSTMLRQIPIIKVDLGQRKGRNINEQQASEIIEEKLDVIIQLGSINIKRVHNLAKHGIWKLRHQYPVGFWEVLKHALTTKSTLEVQTNDRTFTIFESNSPVSPFSVRLTSDNKYWKSAFHIPKMLESLHRKGPSWFFQKHQPIDSGSEVLNGFPSLMDQIALIVDFLIKYIEEKINARLFNEQWIILYHLGKNYSSTFSKYKKLIPPKNKFWADPFVIKREDKYYIFIEESLMGKRKKGYISFMTMDEEGRFEAPQKIIEKPYHLSYPFLFEWENDLYMIPESNGNRTIEVYKCTEFPHSWTFHKNLMEDIIAVDSTLFFYNEKWWLFVNMSDPRGGSSWDELYLYYADAPLSENWKSHPKNPIVSHVAKARPAGNVFQRDGKLYRPAQNCSKRYGYGLIIHQIVCLNEGDYQEVAVDSYLPDWDPAIRGTHTLNREGDLTVIDGILRMPKFNRFTPTMSSE